MFRCFPLNNVDSFFTARQCHPSSFGIIKTLFHHTYVYVLKHKQDIYFFFFSIQNMEINCSIIFLKFFPNIFFWWKIYSFPVIIIYKKFRFVILCWFFFFISSWFNATVTTYWKHSYFLLIEFIVAFLFLIKSGESIYGPPQFGFVLWHL